MKFTAIAFDLDGTLYPDSRLFIRLIPFVIREHRLLLAFGHARRQLRQSELCEANLYEAQAALMAEYLKRPAEEVREKTEKLIYRGWERHFKKIRLFPHVKETLEVFKKEGLKLGLLSDFPPEKKIEFLNLNGYWDAIGCSEVSGRLKPDPKSFLDLARELDVPAEKILYVGNKHSYDVIGARRAGMRTALVKSPFIVVSLDPAPDFVFHDYRQLQKYVLN